MPRYVLLEHDHPFLHWDFMLEDDDVLRTWRLMNLPRPGETIAATALSNHRLSYLDYEGPVSDNRGQVRRLDAGTFAWQTDECNRLEVILNGRCLHGIAVLTRIRGEEWQFRLMIAGNEARDV